MFDPHKYGLTPQQKEERRNSIGASDANIIMSGDQAAITHLYQVKRGEVESEDLSNILPVQMGNFTEPGHRWWFEKQTGRAVTREGERFASADYPFMHVTIDGMTHDEDGKECLLECKHVNQFSKMDDVVNKYQPQLQHGMLVARFERAIISVFIGTMNWEWREVFADCFYQAELQERCLAFWTCVKTGTPPGALPAIKVPSTSAPVRVVSMEGRNLWAAAAADWLDNQDKVRTFYNAENELKELTEPDVAIAHGHGVQVKRDKGGRLRVFKHNGEAK